MSKKCNIELLLFFYTFYTDFMCLVHVTLIFPWWPKSVKIKLKDI